MNVLDDAWDDTPYPTPPGWEQRTKGLLPAGGTLGMRLYELPPGQTQVLYHFHHGNQEAVVVPSGGPTVRTPEASGYSRPATWCSSHAGQKGLTSSPTRATTRRGI